MEFRCSILAARIRQPPALRELLKDEAEMVREAAQHALADIQVPGATR